MSSQLSDSIDFASICPQSHWIQPSSLCQDRRNMLRCQKSCVFFWVKVEVDSFHSHFLNWWIFGKLQVLVHAYAFLFPLNILYLYKDYLGTARAPAQLYIMRIIRQIWLCKSLFLQSVCKGRSSKCVSEACRLILSDCRWLPIEMIAWLMGVFSTWDRDNGWDSCELWWQMSKARIFRLHCGNIGPS